MLIYTNEKHLEVYFRNRNVLARIHSNESGKSDLVITLNGDYAGQQITIPNVSSYRRKTDSDFINVTSLDGKSHWIFLDNGNVDADDKADVRIQMNTFGLKPFSQVRLIADRNGNLYFKDGGREIYLGDVISSDTRVEGHIKLVCQNGTCEFYY